MPFIRPYLYWMLTVLVICAGFAVWHYGTRWQMHRKFDAWLTSYGAPDEAARSHIRHQRYLFKGRWSFAPDDTIAFHGIDSMESFDDENAEMVLIRWNSSGDRVEYRWVTHKAFNMPWITYLWIFAVMGLGAGWSKIGVTQLVLWLSSRKATSHGFAVLHETTHQK